MRREKYKKGKLNGNFKNIEFSRAGFWTHFSCFHFPLGAFAERFIKQLSCLPCDVVAEQIRRIYPNCLTHTHTHTPTLAHTHTYRRAYAFAVIMIYGFISCTVRGKCDKCVILPGAAHSRPDPPCRAPCRRSAGMAIASVCDTCPGTRSMSTTVRTVPWFTAEERDKEREGEGKSDIIRLDLIRRQSPVNLIFISL